MNQLLIALMVAAAASSTAARAGAQLTLGEAMRQADRFAYGNRIAAGATAAQAARTLSPLKGILPTVRFEAGYVRTTDPVGVFGSSLRQRTITQADFDPLRLNYPGPAGNFQGGIVVEQPIFNADAWTGRRAAMVAVDASRASEEWTRLSTRVHVVRAYYGAVLAAERVRTLQAAARAARAHVTQSEAMVRQGLVTRSDALLASVRAGEMDAQLAEADGGAVTARRQLVLLLGRDGGDLPSELAPPLTLPSVERIRSVIGADTAEIVPQPRADVRAASSGLEAARADQLRARSAYLPRLNSFARYDWNSADRLYAGDRNWTVGLMASWSPFAGASDLADVQITAGQTATAAAQAEAARANARLDVEQSRVALSVALARLAIAERAVAQSAEANRIVGRKYAGGLASMIELLDAQAVETQSALGLSQARWSAISAAAERRRALGLDPATLAALDEGTMLTAAGTQQTSGSSARQPEIESIPEE
jgi:outer membrane protein